MSPMDDVTPAALRDGTAAAGRAEIAPLEEITRKTLQERFEPILLGAGTILAFLLVWQIVPSLVPLSKGMQLFFTTPSAVAHALYDMFARGTIWGDFGVSASAFASGLGLAIVVGLPIGIVIGRSERLNAMLDPFITALNATPRLVFLPLVVLWFGLGLWSTVFIVFIGAVFPLLINTYAGVRNADRVLINVVRSFGANEWEIAKLVVLPNSVPFVVAGLRLAIGRAILGVVVAEFFGANAGIGVMMVQAAQNYKVDILFSGLIIFMSLSLVMTALVTMLEHRFSRWRPEKVKSF